MRPPTYDPVLLQVVRSANFLVFSMSLACQVASANLRQVGGVALALALADGLLRQQLFFPINGYINYKRLCPQSFPYFTRVRLYL